jgi:hypothetical protein
MLRVITWPSEETAPRLTSKEAEVLFEFSRQMAECGELSDGKYVGASQPLWWERLKGGN